MTAREPSFARREQRFAGRRLELSRLEAEWEKAEQGTWRVALVCGEPGIGKTRLAAELSSRVHALGGVALYGRCDEETIVPYQPFVEALRPCLDRYTKTAGQERVRGLEEPLARVFPAEFAGRVPAPSLSSPSEPEAERYRLFEAMTALLTATTTSHPTLLVLDDLQWADKPTLLLLRHVVRSVPRGGLLAVACYRDVELHAGNPLAETLADLHRDSTTVTRATLAGLSEEESGELLSGLVGRELGDPTVAALHSGTEGNPFFLGELLRDLMDSDVLAQLEAGGPSPVDLAGLSVPEGVRELVVRRLGRLPEDVTVLMSIAAVIGHRFDAALVARAAEESLETVVERLELAIEAGLVQEDSAQLEQYVFSHALVRQTLNAELGRARHVRLHADVANALEEMGGSEHRAAELALHFVEALPLVDAAKAITFTTRAGHDALSEFAYEDAATYLQRALDLLDRYAPADMTQRVDLLTARASALVYVDERAGVEAALTAVDAARAHGSSVQFGRAVGVFVEPMYAVEAFPLEVASLLDEARSVLGDNEPALRARMLAFEAFKYTTHWLQGRDGQTLSAQAVSLARDIDDPLALADALLSLASSLEGRPTAPERMAIGEELVGLGGAAGARASAFGLRVLAGAYLELGRAEELTSTIDQLARIGEETHWLPAHVYAAQWRATQALLEGRFDDVRAHGTVLRGYSRAYRGADGLRLFQALHLAREVGDLSGVTLGSEDTGAFSGDLYLAALRALVQLESGHPGAAQASLDALMADDLHENANDNAWGPALGTLAEVAAGRSAPAPAAVLYEYLTPFEGQLLAVYLGIACLGAADRYLGMLSTVLERWDEAEAHFERAVALETRCRGHALLPRTRFWQAKFLRARRAPGDDRAAQELLSSVAEDSSRLGMRTLGAEAEGLRSARG